jgi:hypothetical protein
MNKAFLPLIVMGNGALRMGRALAAVVPKSEKSSSST